MKVKKTNQRPYDDKKTDILFDLGGFSASSAYEFTGMLPTPPQSEEEAKSYQEILDYTPEPEQEHF